MIVVYSKNMTPGATVRMEQSKYAHRLLLAAAAHFFGKETAPLRDARGKLYDPTGAFSFSLSHDGDGVAVVLSVGARRLGIDLLCPRQGRPMEGIHKRFLSALNPPAGRPDFTLYRAFLSGEGFVFSKGQPMGCPPVYDESFLRAEAVLKAEGGGFRSLGELGPISAGSHCASFVVREGYEICVAEYVPPV